MDISTWKTTWGTWVGMYCTYSTHLVLGISQLWEKRFAFAMIVWKIFNQESSLNLHKMCVPQQVQHRVHHAKTETNSMIPSGRDSSSKVMIFLWKWQFILNTFFHSFANPNVCAFVHHRAIVFLLSDTLPSHSATGMASVKHEANAAASNCNPTTRLRNLDMSTSVA